jgi:hypothetical protein
MCTQRVTAKDDSLRKKAMSDIQRWGPDWESACMRSGFSEDEKYVLYNSAVAAVAAARKESYNDGLMRGRYERQVDAAIKGDSDD